MTFDLVLDAIFSSGNAIHTTFITCFFFMVLCFITSTVTNNYSQVDKLWSIVPMIYSWQLVVDSRTMMMAIVITIWGMRLTYNFHRRGGYGWPPWTGDEDYRWSYLQTSEYMPFLKNRYVWCLFNIFFISIFQHLLLLLIVSPSMVAYVMATTTTSSSDAKLHWGDWMAAVLILTLILVETTADNQQYIFQTIKYRQKELGIKLEGHYADGFCQTGLFQHVRKPNYAAEQAIWISYYIFSITATGGHWINWSVIGWILLIALFQGSGKFSEYITSQKYPKYINYQQCVPLYIPSILAIIKKTKNKSF